MKLRIDSITAGLCLLFLAGCTSPETQAIAPAPIAEPAIAEPTMLVPDVPPAAALPAQPSTPPVAAEAQGQANIQHGFNCRTVGNATMCDAPPITGSEDKLYTN